MKQKHWKVSVFDKTSETVRDDAFYTTDTEAYLVFELVDEGFVSDLATVTAKTDKQLTFKMRNSGSSVAYAQAFVQVSCLSRN